jgi:hypothetical protein
VRLTLVAQDVGLGDDQQGGASPASCSSAARMGEANGSARRSTSGQ